MGAAFAGIIRVPLTSVIMIFEITRDYSIIVPLMIANLISYFISSRLQEEPIYEALQHQDGIHLPSGARAREDFATVALALHPETELLVATMTVAQATAAVDRSRGAWPVMDEGGFRGMITVEDLAAAMQDGYGDRRLGEMIPSLGPPESLTEDRFPHLHLDHSLDAAMRRITQSGLTALPVVSRSNLRDLKGTISVQDVLDSYAIARPAEAPNEPQASPRLFAAVVATLMGLALLIGFVNYFQRLERTNRARHEYETAQQLMQQGSYEEAVGHFRAALSSSHNPDYRLALGEALVKAGHLNEAPIFLTEALRDHPTSGRANLALARVAAEQGQTDDAVAHYQRAIYGAWTVDARENQLQARLELIDLLRKAGRTQQAQAELLSASAAIPPSDVLDAKRVARMLIDIGLPKTAENMFRDLAHRNPKDAEAIQGLADAQFSDGDYAAARASYERVLTLVPDNAAANQRLEECNVILTPPAPAPRKKSRRR